MRYPTIWESIGIGATVIFSIIAIIIATPQIDLVISEYGYTESYNEIFFDIANNGDKIAYVDRIDLEITNLQLLNECTWDFIDYSLIPQRSMVPLNITMNDDVYSMKGFIENVHGYEHKGDMDYYPVENGLKYGKGDIDGFTQYILLIDNNGTIIDNGYTFDAKIKVFWCEINQCDEKNILESEQIIVMDIARCGSWAEKQSRGHISSP